MDPPTLSSIADQTIAEGTYLRPLAFTITDPDKDMDLDYVTLIARSSDESLVPLSNITFTGTGANRKVNITPAAGKSGSAII